MAAAEKRCVIICASPDAEPEFIRRQIRSDDYIICADGGADVAAKAGLTPQLIVGDFDSAAEKSLFPQTECIELSTHKDDTDTMHCAQAALERGYRNFLFLGASGGRSDHFLANLSVLLYLSDNGAAGEIADSTQRIMLLHHGENHFSSHVGQTISVLPFAAAQARLTYTGMEYPMNNGMVTAQFPFTISNTAAANEITVTLHEGSALIFFIAN